MYSWSISSLRSFHIVIELVQVEIVRNTSTLDCIDQYEVQ